MERSKYFCIVSTFANSMHHQSTVFTLQNGNSRMELEGTVIMQNCQACLFCHQGDPILFCYFFDHHLSDPSSTSPALASVEQLSFSSSEKMMVKNIP